MVVYATILAVPLALFAPFIFALWVGPGLDLAPSLLIGLAIWKIIKSGGFAISVFLNGAHIIWMQVITACITAAVVIPLAIVLVGQIGVGGSIWAMILGFAVCTALPYAFLVPHALRNLKNEAAS